VSIVNDTVLIDTSKALVIADSITGSIRVFVQILIAESAFIAVIGVPIVAVIFRIVFSVL
jgi:hypothetical protein